MSYLIPKKEQSGLHINVLCAFVTVVAVLMTFLLSFPSYSFALEDHTVFNPKRFDRLKGKPTVYTETFERCLPATEALLRVWNGDSKETRIKSADIYLNGVEVVHENEFKQQAPYIEKLVPIGDVNDLKVTLKSGHQESPSKQDILTSFLKVEVVAKGCDFVPPVVNNSSPADGAFLNTATPAISARYADDAEGSGLDLSTAAISLDARDITSDASVSGTGISYRPRPDSGLSEGEHRVVVIVADFGSNRASLSWQFTTDTIPPEVNITSHDNDVYLSAQVTDVAGTVNEPVRSVTVNGRPAEITDGGYLLAGLELEEGANTITVEATDRAGNVGTQAVSVFVAIAPPVVTIVSPVNLSTVGSSPITVTGTVSKTDIILTVNGVEVPVNQDGTYSVDGIVLTEGGNTIVATAIDGANNVGTANIHLYFDSTPPRVVITYPEDGAAVTSSPITVTGSIFDIVKGEINEENASVQVNGIPAPVSNKTFIAENVPLEEGENIITAIGADQTGNTDSISITVTLDLSVNKKINMVSGNNQSGSINSLMPNPLKVSLINADGSPAAGKNVIFKVVQNNGRLTSGTDQVQAMVVVSDSNGEAEAILTLGATAGGGNNKVEAVAVGFSGKVVFTASGLVDLAHKINVGSGSNQRGAVNTPLPKPLIAYITDEGHNPVKGVPVTFSAESGGGNFDGAPSIVVNTDSDGRATANLTLGPDAGLDNNLVKADFEGNQTGSAIFRASGLAVGDPGDTKVSGVVMDNSNNPIPGVTMRIEGTTRQAVTDTEGLFMIENVPVGPLHMIVDGSTATIEGEYPVLSFEIDTVSGQNNTLGMPIYLLPLNTSNTLWVGGDDDVVYELDNIPGFSLTVKANSVTFPDGTQEGSISVTQVNADKMPMEPPNGLQPRFIITIQPPGAVFDPPAPITLPNVDGLAPGSITEMYSFDHDLGQFVSIGTGTVSEDGMLLKSDSGVGVIKAGWHGGGDPAQTGCTNHCGDCKNCDGNCNCVADDSNVPDNDTVGDCKKPGCSGGSPIDVPDDADVPSEVCTECSNGTKKEAPTDAKCCADYLGTRTNLLGTVICCRESPLLCMYPANFPNSYNATGDSIGYSCVEVHEASHVPDRVCNSGDCNTVGSLKGTAADSECEASKKEKQCLLGKRSTCGSDIACIIVVDAWITEAENYGNGFVPGCL